MATPHVEEDYNEDSQSTMEDNSRETPDLPLTYAGMSGFAADIKAAFSSSNNGLKI